MEQKAVEAVKPEPSPEPLDPEPAATPGDQPALGDFGLYKCLVCGKMVMGYEKENHAGERHGGKSVEWKRMR